MAKCKDCSKEVGFLKKRCPECDTLFKENEAIKKAEQEENERLARIESRKKSQDEQLQNDIKNLWVTWDKFEEKGSIKGHDFKINGTTFTFSCVNNKYYWLVATQKQPDWDWLENNRSIILFDDGTRFVQEHGSLRATDVTTDWANDVVCYEEHHIGISEAVPVFVEYYNTYKYEDSAPPVYLRIGNHEYRIPSEKIRELVAISLKAGESN